MKRSSVVEEWQAGPRAEGLAFGRVKGEIEGRVAALLEVLESRFGAVPVDLVDKIKSTADLDTLRAWLRVVAKADSLGAVRSQSDL